LKPLIFQERTTPELEALTSTQDEAVFMRDEYRYGIRYRCNAGLGFWQMAYKSQATLDTANFNAAIAKEWRFQQGRQYRLSFRAEAFNAANHAQFDEPQRNLSSPAFGKITNTLNDGRVFQFTLRVQI